MQLIYGEIVTISDEEGLKMGKVRIGRALQNVPLALLDSARPGDRVLLCDGVAISTVQEEMNDVSGDPRKGD